MSLFCLDHQCKRLTRHTASRTFQNDFHALDTRVNQFKTLVSSLNDPQHHASLHRQRGVLLTRTLLYCATVQLYARTNQRWDSEDNKMLEAANAAADAIENINFDRIGYVDPVLGVSIMLCMPVSYQANIYIIPGALDDGRPNIYHCLDCPEEYIHFHAVAFNLRISRRDHSQDISQPRLGCYGRCKKQFPVDRCVSDFYNIIHQVNLTFVLKSRGTHQVTGHYLYPAWWGYLKHNPRF